MKTLLKYSALLLAGGLGACAVAPPSAPSIAAMPGQGKTFDQFTADDAACRGYASTRVPPNAQQVTGQNSVGTAIGGAALGAGAGALIGSTAAAVGTGAAVGAGVGLLAGSAIAADNTAGAGYAMQRNYDVAYAQCMASKGDKVPDPGSFGTGAYGPPYYGYPDGWWGYPGVYGGWGWGWRGGWGYGWHGGWGWHGRWR